LEEIVDYSVEGGFEMVVAGYEEDDEEKNTEYIVGSLYVLYVGYWVDCEEVGIVLPP
jgi:hypothetical protein